MLLQLLLLIIFICPLSFALTAQTAASVKDIYKTMKKVADWQIHVLENKP
ncbi:MAG: hypothetical protein ABIW38_06830 [Ferruginibacter sp.]